MFCKMSHKIWKAPQQLLELTHDEGPYHIETSRLICTVNQWTGSYIIGTSVMKELSP